MMDRKPTPVPDPSPLARPTFRVLIVDDSAVVREVLTLLGPGEFAPTIEMKVAFLRPARTGTRSWLTRSAAAPPRRW